MGPGALLFKYRLLSEGWEGGFYRASDSQEGTKGCIRKIHYALMRASALCNPLWYRFRLIKCDLIFIVYYKILISSDKWERLLLYLLDIGKHASIVFTSFIWNRYCYTLPKGNTVGSLWVYQQTILSYRYNRRKLDWFFF